MKWVSLVIPKLVCFLLIVLIFPFPVLSQPVNDQNWNLNVTITSDTITIDCSEFLLPADKGAVLEELDPINSKEGEFSQSMLAAHIIKITLLPQSGTADNLANINGCTQDGTLVMLAPDDPGDILTLTSSGNIEFPEGISVVLDSPTDLALLVLRGSTYYMIGGLGNVEVIGGGGGIGKVITDAIDPASAFIVGNGSNGFRFYADGTNAYLECFIGGAPCPPDIVISSGQALQFLHGTAPMLTLAPEAASSNARYPFSVGYKPVVSAEVTLHPIPGTDATVAREAIITNGATDDWITFVDAVGDGVDFSFKITPKLVGNTTVNMTFHAVNKNASPTGTFTLRCAGVSVRPGLSAFAAHSTTGFGDASITSWVEVGGQPSPATAVSNFTINGTVAENALIQGRCTVQAAPGQIADIRLHGTAVVELEANSLSD